MENNKHSDAEILLKLVRLAKARKAKALERNELDCLDDAIKAIKKIADKSELVGYLVVGIDKNGNTIQTCCGCMVDEMLADLHKEIVKRNRSFGETILSRLKSNLENESTKSEKDDECDTENDAENRKKKAQKIADFIWENLVEEKDEK